MNIVRLILDNLHKGTVSFRLPHQHQCTSNRYRGPIHNDPEKCVGCASCVYPCPTAAIEVTRKGDEYSWTYDPGKCTFCGRCIDRCRPQSLTMASQLPPIYSTQGELKQTLNMVRKRPVRPATPAAKPAAAASSAPAQPPIKMAESAPEMAT